MSYLGYDVNKDVTQPQINPIGSLQAGQNFSEGLLKQKQAQKLANAQDQYANAPDYATQQGALRQLSAYSPAMSESVRVNQASAKAQRDEFLARGANDILQAPPEQQADMHDQLVQQGIQQGFLPPETAQHIGKFDQSDIAEMQNLVRKAQPLSAISPAAQQAARIQQMKEMAELSKLQAETNKTNMETNNLSSLGYDLPLKNAGQLGSQAPQLPQQSALGAPIAQPTNVSPLLPVGSQLGAKSSGAEQAAALVPPDQMTAADQGVAPITAPAKISQATAPTIELPKGLDDIPTKDLKPIPSPLDAYDTSGIMPRTLNTAKMYLDGRAPIPAITNRTPPYIQQALAIAMQADPSLDATAYKKRQETVDDLASGKGAQMRKSANMTMEHLDDLNTSFAKLNNSGIADWINIPKDSLKKFNNPEFQKNYKEAKENADAAGNEMAQLLRNTGMAEADIKNWQDTFQVNQTPASMEGAIHKAMELIRGRLDSVKSTYETGLNAKIEDPLQILNPKSQKIYNKLMGITPGTSTNTPKESAQVASEPMAAQVPLIQQQAARAANASKQAANFAPHEVQAEIVRRKAAGLM